jgi:hypothetical protein
MRLYHLTTEDAVPLILAEGFRETGGDSFLPAGVRLSDSAYNLHRAMRRCRRGVMLAVEVPTTSPSDTWLRNSRWDGESSASRPT